MNRYLRKILIILFWLAVWQAVVAVAGDNLFVAGPVEIVQRLAEYIKTADYWKTTAMSFSRIGLGFAASFILGICMAFCADRSSLFGELTEPVILTMRTIPVASFVVLLLIFAGAENLSFYVTFMVVLPIIYSNMQQGLGSVDASLMEYAKVYRIKRNVADRYIVRPAYMPYLISGAKTASGMGIKSGVAAEIIGLPVWSVGSEMYMSKIYFDTAGVFAWTVTAIILSALLESVVLLVLKAFWRNSERYSGGVVRMPYGESEGSFVVRNISKAYNGRMIIGDFSKELLPGHIYAVAGASGAGKTTLLKMLAGVVKPDRGEIKPYDVVMMFQEDRLIPSLSAIDNIRLVTGSSDIDEYMKKCGLSECGNRKISELSGGMSRRVALLRALLTDSKCIILDEPFNGLDEENRRQVADVIRELGRGRIIIISQHEKGENDYLDAELITLDL